MAEFWWLMPLLAGLLLALVAGPLGSFVVWRRMAFFGDTLAHGALLGITFGVLTDINLTLALVFGSMLLALVLLPLERRARLSSDTLLGIVSHSTLAIGLVTLSLAQGVRVDLMGYLFGDLLAVEPADVLWILAAAVLVLILLVWQWRPLLAITVSSELATIDGLPVKRLNAMLILLLALIVALAMKVVGILLVSALLIIPPAVARTLSRSPEQMVLLASGAGALSVLGGLWASFRWDTPAGPSVVVTATSLFALVLIGQSLRGLSQR
ncbi:zinc ABC transporter permease subunit ZnuB [Thalassolituus sp. LLYu03]|uniref:zinc ABC transporter permease subunit ZnuB n=1 Tax=Thalassolituus sp. LLYu03 TaxID=3421656 RepID=UPI003D2D36F7